MKIFVAICVLMTVQLAVGYPQRKKDLDKKVSREGRSDLLQGCTPQQLLDLDQENIACYKRADAQVSRLDNLKEVCTAIEAKLKCLEQNVGKCLNDQGKQNIRLTFLKEQVDQAKKNNQEQLVSQCPPLQNYKSSYLQEVFGSNKCSYDAVTSIVDKSNECNKVAQEKWATKVDELAASPNKKELFTRASCDLRKEVDRCNVDLYNCMSPDRVAADRSNWDHLEAIFTETQGIGDFSFDTACK